MQSPKAIINRYRQKRMRITPQRRLIMELLIEDNAHPCVYEIYEQAKAQMPDISRATVYNIFNELEELGAIKKLDYVMGSCSRYDTNIQPHDHFNCTECGQMVDISKDPCANDIDHNKLSGFKIEKCQVTFYGICPDCQKKM